MMMERVSDKELLSLIDAKQDRLKDIYDEQVKLQKEVADLVDVMMDRGLERAE